MTFARTLLLVCAALAIAAPGDARAPARHRRHAAVDWTRTVAATPDGGVRVGNPKAKVALVEFFSFTCPHCAAFAAEAYPAIRDKYVRSGKVSFEVRVALRDRADLVAASLAQCAGPQRYFATAEALFAAQADWETKAIGWDSGHPAAFDGPDGPAAMTAFAKGTGLDLIGKAHGVAPATLPHCFADKTVRDNVTKTTAEAWDTRKIGGTPGFLINGTLAGDVHGWSTLEPALQAAING